MNPPFSQLLAQAVAVFEGLKSQEPAFESLAQSVVVTLRQGGTLYTCGNGGSAADALHLAEELVGRYKGDRRPLAAVCLNADPTLLTCIANDYGFEQVFARQVDALAKPGDLVLGFTTSGQSPNILAALKAARAKGVRTAALLGKSGGAAQTLADLAVVVAGTDTARIQEAHTFLLHVLLDRIEAGLGLSGKG
jgi:D-sedoheptulose 7-phosphate isomerase